jgi:hypothetical protein
MPQRVSVAPDGKHEADPRKSAVIKEITAKNQYPRTEFSASWGYDRLIPKLQKRVHAKVS